MRPEDFIERLSSVTWVGNREWMAACPAAPLDDPHRLLVRAGEAENTVVQCCSSCATDDVLKAMGLRLMALTERGRGKTLADYNSKWRAELVLFALQQEIATVYDHAGDMKNGRALGAAEFQRLALAKARLGNALTYVRALDISKVAGARVEIGDAY